MKLRRFLAGDALLALAAPLLADAPGVYAIVGGTLHPVSGSELTNGAVIIRDGLIEADGSAHVIRPDAAIVDALHLPSLPQTPRQLVLLRVGRRDDLTARRTQQLRSAAQV